MSKESFCVNFTVQMLEQKTSPVFQSTKLRTSQHEFCECHAVELPKAASFAACVEFDAQKLIDSCLCS